MATTRSSITRLLRAAVSHPSTTTLLRPYHNLLRPHHIFTPTSPLSFLSSHPVNHRISSHHLFSTLLHVRPRATKSRLRRFCGKLIYGMFLVIFQICITGGCLLMVGKFGRKSHEILDEETGTKFKGSFRDFLRKGHTVVFQGFIRPVNLDTVDWGYEYYYLVTEVLSEPDQIVAAMERNSFIIADKLNAANEKQNVVAEEEKQNVSGEEREVVINWCTTRSEEISNDVADPLKSKPRLKGLVLEGRVNQSAACSLLAKILIAKLLRDALKNFKGSSDALQEGHSVFIERSVKPIKHWIKEEEDKSGKSVAVKVWDSDCHLSAKVLVKHDDKRMVRDAVAAAIEE